MIDDDPAPTGFPPATGPQRGPLGHVWPPLSSQAKDRIRALFEPLLVDRPAAAVQAGVTVSLTEPTARLTFEQVRLLWWAERYLLAPRNLSAQVAVRHPDDHVLLTRCGLRARRQPTG